jgi:hypothetical protein
MSVPADRSAAAHWIATSSGSRCLRSRPIAIRNRAMPCFRSREVLCPPFCSAFFLVRLCHKLLVPERKEMSATTRMFRVSARGDG